MCQRLGHQPVVLLGGATAFRRCGLVEGNDVIVGDVPLKGTATPWFLL